MITFPVAPVAPAPLQQLMRTAETLVRAGSEAVLRCTSTTGCIHQKLMPHGWNRTASRSAALVHQTSQTTPVPQPTLIEVPASTPQAEVTGRCGRCTTDMPMTALRVFSAGVPSLGLRPWGLRCVNESACADRERKYFARLEDLAAWQRGARARGAA